MKINLQKRVFTLFMSLLILSTSIPVQAAGMDTDQTNAVLTEKSLKKVKKPSLNSHGSVYASIPSLGVTYSVKANQVKYGASCMKFTYSYYAYCVKNWGKKKLTYNQNGKRVKKSLEYSVMIAMKNSDNDASKAIFEYIRTNSSRRKGFQNWMKKVLKKKVPVANGSKYRIGYNSSSAYCPFTTAKEVTAFWKYIWKNGYANKNKMKLKRYQNFFDWTSTTWLNYNHGVQEEHGKVGWLPYLSDKKVSQWSVYTNGAFYRIKLADGKTYTMFVTYMQDYIKEGTTIFDTIDEVVGYVKYLGEKKLQQQGKLT